MDTTSLGDRMKLYEAMGEGKLMPLLPVCARLDGKAFHTFTRGLKRPFDERLQDLMTETTKALVDYSNALIGYTQSDEITLIWLAENFDGEIFMGGRQFKMISILAAYATSVFTKLLPKYLPEKSDAAPLFDCRVWNVPNQIEACNVLVWREQDATRNSIQMAGQSVFSHAELMNKSCDEIQEMLFNKGINWNDYPARFKRGAYVQRRAVSKPFTTEELEALPPKHHARTNPDLVVERHEMRVLEMPVFTKLINKTGVVFDGEDPLSVTLMSHPNEDIEYSILDIQQKGMPGLYIPEDGAYRCIIKNKWGLWFTQQGVVEKMTDENCPDGRDVKRYKLKRQD